jgi:hypothetical protein
VIACGCSTWGIIGTGLAWAMVGFLAGYLVERWHLRL